MPEESLLLRIRAAGARSAAAGVKSVGGAVRGVDRAATSGSKGLGRFGSMLGKTNSRLSTASRGLKNAGSSFSALTFPILGAAAVSGKLAIDFDRSMRNVNSIAQLPEKQLMRLRQHVLDLAGPTAQAPQTLSEGLYTLVSSGFDAKQSLIIMKNAAKAATAGLTDAATSTKVMAAVLNAYRLPASKAKEVSDILFRTVDRGVISFEELSQNIGDTLPFASSLGVSLTEVGAATATMTKQGLGAPETMTRIRNLLQTMIKPGDALKKKFKELGVESGEALIKQKGFQGALDALIGSTDGSKKAVAKLFPNIRALGGALALTGDNTKAANADLKGMQGASGATSRALSQQSKSAAFQWNRFMATVKVLAIELGTTFLPVLKDVVDWLGGVVKAFDKLAPSQKKTIIIVALVLGVLGPLLIVLGAIVGAVAVLATTTGAVTVGLVALGAGVVYAYTRWGWFRDIVEKVWWLIKHSPLGLLVTHIDDVVGGVKSMVDFFKKIPGAIRSGFIVAINWMIDRINDVIGFVNDVIEQFNKIPFGPDIATIGEVGHVATTTVAEARRDQGRTRRFEPNRAPTPAGGHRTGLAAGGDVLRSGVFDVGEHGRETVFLPEGTAVRHPQPESALDERYIEATVHVHTHLDGKQIAKSTAKQRIKARSVA